MTFKAPAEVLIAVDGVDNPSYGHVIRIFAGSTLLHAVVLDPLIPIMTIPNQFHFTFDWSKVPAGQYVLTASIDDVVSQPVKIEVKAKRRRSH